MRKSLHTLALAAAGLLAACGSGGEEPAAEPAVNPIEERVAPTRDAAAEAERQMQESQRAMEAQAREAAGEPADTTTP